jgi:poly-gamma-glutamate capsule biosynthesis protein CapA/YwtB (metallophosphatase superfamily)
MHALTAPTTGNARTRSQRLNWAGIVTLAIASCAALVLSVVVHRRGAPPRATFSFELRVVDERGQAIAGAVFAAAGKQWQTDASGEARIAADGVLAGSLHAQGYLDEPVVVGSESRGRAVTVRLWARLGGRRFSYHAAGDVMLARRYLDRRPGATTTRLDGGRLRESAGAIVSQVAPIFRAATLSSVNLETVVGELPRSAAYPGKDLVIQTPPQALAGLEQLSVDAALGANNHVRDYGDEGIASTRRAVEARGIAYGGAGLDARAAARPVRIGRGPAALVLLAFSGLSGDGVNDAYTAEPGPTSPAWLTERRPWAYRAGGRALLPPRQRTIGEAWKVFRRLEHENARAASRAWNSLAAVYPELQDWVARRGHAGAAPWDPERSTAAIQAAARGNGPVVVQLQDGIQYAPAPPSRLIETARAAIDAGADIVIAHHPHVLQGFELYRGKLIAFSLGNFVFDQDLLVTYPGGFLRTIWEGDRLLEARFVPTILAGYRPLPVAGPTATRMLRRLVADSVLPARSSRRASDRTRLMPRRLEPDSIVRGQLERNTLLLLRASARRREHRPRPAGDRAVVAHAPLRVGRRSRRTGSRRRSRPLRLRIVRRCSRPDGRCAPLELRPSDHARGRKRQRAPRDQALV